MLSNLLKSSDSNKGVYNNNNPYLEFKSATPMTIIPRYTATGVSIQYSLDTINWYDIVNNTTTPSATTIYFRGRATEVKSLTNSIGETWSFTGATQLEANGSLTMLLQDEFGGNKPDIALGRYAFSYMFNGCSALVKAPELPSTILGEACYNYLFYECTNLPKAPALPATTLVNKCYYGLFWFCNNLIEPPALPATTLATNCYSYMFLNCIKLTTLPALPALHIPYRAYYYMFWNCVSLKASGTKVNEYQYEFRIPTNGTGTVDSEGTNLMFSSSTPAFDSSPTINRTYYVPNELIQ